MTTALDGGEWSAAHLGRTLPPGKTRYPFYRRLGGPQGRSGRAENLVPTGNRSRTVQPVVSRYTDWATRPTNGYVNFWYLADYFLEWEMFQTKVVKKITTYILCSTTVSGKSCHLWGNVENAAEPGRSQMTLWRMHIACRMTKATYTHPEYVVFIAFRTTVVMRTVSTYIAYLVSLCTSILLLNTTNCGPSLLVGVTGEEHCWPQVVNKVDTRAEYITMSWSRIFLPWRGRGGGGGGRTIARREEEDE